MTFPPNARVVFVNTRRKSIRLPLAKSYEPLPETNESRTLSSAIGSIDVDTNLRTESGLRCLTLGVDNAELKRLLGDGSIVHRLSVAEPLQYELGIVREETLRLKGLRVAGVYVRDVIVPGIDPGFGPSSRIQARSAYTPGACRTKRDFVP